MKRMIMGAAGLLAACTTTSASVDIVDMAPNELPESVLAVIFAERADFTAEDVQKKTRDGRVYFDVEGIIGDGSALEFDVLMSPDGPEIVEVQRDLPWSEVPGDVRTIALDASDGAEPVRIIESVQTDGAVIYELFAKGQPNDPAIEIRTHAGKVELLEERWIH